MNVVRCTDSSSTKKASQRLYGTVWVEDVISMHLIRTHIAVAPRNLTYAYILYHRPHFLYISFIFMYLFFSFFFLFPCLLLSLSSHTGSHIQRAPVFGRSPSVHRLFVYTHQFLCLFFSFLKITFTPLSSVTLFPFGQRRTSKRCWHSTTTVSVARVV